ncbi:DUF2225 domain-containing protein [Paenibacillus sp. GCM10027626]|uniref:DUF2225 domain-containing protein n=1 Tax=Paenibacillus sp. GCM10027626 TaxID=3273411 RepID=UPI003632C129
MEPLYQTVMTCVCCEKAFQTSRIRPSFKRVAGRDSDFCAHYHHINPDYYVVRVCPACGYASTENGLTALTDAMRDKYVAEAGSQWISRDYGGERTVGQAMECYKLALNCAQIVSEKDRVIAGLLHHIAWLYREMGDQQQEAKFLRFALERYINVYENEGSSINNAKLMYLIGELHRRLGERGEAVRWFSRVVNDKKIVDTAMIQASRAQWQLIREQESSAPTAN